MRHASSLREMSVLHMLETLRKTDGNVSQAAKLLWLSRTTLYRVLNKQASRKPDDATSHSAWCCPSMLAPLLGLKSGLAASNRVDTMNALARFLKTPAFGAMISGGLVLVFSRVFDMGHLWHLILRDGSARLANPMVAEGLGLLAYLI